MKFGEAPEFWEHNHEGSVFLSEIVKIKMEQELAEFNIEENNKMKWIFYYMEFGKKLAVLYRVRY